MGCQVHAGILTEDKKLTQKAYDRFVAEVKDIVLNGSQNLKIRTPFPCGDPIPANPDMKPEDFVLEDTSKFPDFHKNVVVGQYEKLVVSLDMDPTFSLLPVLADPIALAGSFGVELSPLSFPAGYLPYFTGLLVPKFAIDLASAGVTDFVPPMLLIPELTKLISIPKPPPIEMPPNVSLPISPIDVPAPPAVDIKFSMPGLDVELPPTPELPDPLKLLPEYVDVKVSMATGIPNLLLQLISKMPQLLPKLVDIKSVFAEICAMVRDSGVFGNVKSTSVVQQAANVVLARKTSECLFIAALSQTVGTSPGSVASGVSKTVLEYDALEQPTPTPKSLTPQQKAVQWANSLIGKSYGSAPETYISKLFYIEEALANMPNETINIYGEPMSDEQRTANTVKAGQTQINYDITPVEQTSGFKNVAAAMAQEASSCGIFARSCYYAAGCNNRWFISQYIASTATEGFRFIGTLRNYRWVIKDPNDPAKDVINDELVNLSNTILPVKKGGTQIDPWVLTKRIVTQSDGTTKYEFVPRDERLLPHLKPFSERALIGIEELQSIARGEHADCPEFPALEPADVLLINNPKKENTQHVLVITQPRSAGFVLVEPEKKGSRPRLQYPLSGVDGGQTDTSNKGSALDAVKSDIYKDKLLESFVEPEKIVLTPNYQDGKPLKQSEYVEIGNNAGKYYIEGDRVMQLYIRHDATVDKPVNVGDHFLVTNWGSMDVTDTLAVGKPTAILLCNYDIGSIKKDRNSEGGFYIGESRLFVSNGTQMSNSDLKLIGWIARGANFLDPRENETPVGMEACIYMDDVPALRDLMGNYKYVHDLAPQYCFPTVTNTKGMNRLKQQQKEQQEQKAKTP